MELSPILTVLRSGHQNLHETYQCRMYSRKLLMMGKEVARNTEFYDRINLDNQCVWLVIKKKKYCYRLWEKNPLLKMV